ncbi:NAD(P)/FAD-dependent oxidoreductase [Pseudactinotalea sp.]|uniref:NAD(P)/FAD-dependent oxidoreductase n=1 Tax=Pseudactinotalea sp. TaxID=1926260 RepID=UPI003B3A9528
MRRAFPAPTSAVVVGAGIVGLATAWHLRRAGLDVRVIETDTVAAGSSWGNAGWLTPPITTPLPEPAILRTGLRAMFSVTSPLYVPLRPDLTMIRFMLGFLRHSTASAWRRAMQTYIPLNQQALDAFDELAAGGVAEATHVADPFLACFAGADEHRLLMEEFEQIRAAGQPVSAELISGEAVRAIAPAVSDDVANAIRLEGTRFLHPPHYLDALATAVRREGATIHEHTVATEISGGTPSSPASVRIRTDQGEDVLNADVVVLATGAWLGRLARSFGVRMVVQAGRGYSFTVPVDPMPRVPLYFPIQRVACTPLGDRYRVAGMMEFRRPGEPLDPRRIDAIVRAARPLLAGADFDDRQDEWVGSRPCTPDGLPLIGPTRSPRVIAAGGHGMWGITLGPLTGRLVADLVTTGETPEVLRPLDPLR